MSSDHQGLAPSGRGSFLARETSTIENSTHFTYTDFVPRYPFDLLQDEHNLRHGPNGRQVTNG